MGPQRLHPHSQMRLSSQCNSLFIMPYLAKMKLISRERLADDKFREICVCVSPTQAKKYAIKPVIPKTYHQPDAP